MARPRLDALSKTLSARSTHVNDALANDHWFDALALAMVLATSRRKLLTAAAIAAACPVVGAPLAEAAKPRKKRKRKRKKKAKPKPKPTSSCSGGACAAVPFWAGDENEIAYCEFVCEQCPGNDPQRFCILGGQIADCCDEGLTCCGDTCVNTFDDDNHCGTCNHRCSPGKVCFGGDCLCQDGLTLCDDICRDTDRDENNCGGCDRPCTGAGMQCCDGECRNTRFDSDYCGPLCQRCSDLGLGLTCCDGFCVDLNYQELHCGACGASCQPGQLCCHGVGRGCIDSCGGFCTCGAGAP